MFWRGNIMHPAETNIPFEDNKNPAIDQVGQL